MLHPSYSEMIDVLNEDVKEGEQAIVSSRYSIVLATAKRARSLIEGETAFVKIADIDKPLSIAIRELATGKVKIKPTPSHQLPVEESFVREDI